MTCNFDFSHYAIITQSSAHPGGLAKIHTHCHTLTGGQHEESNLLRINTICYQESNLILKSAPTGTCKEGWWRPAQIIREEEKGEKSFVSSILLFCCLRGTSHKICASQRCAMLSLNLMYFFPLMFFVFVCQSVHRKSRIVFCTFEVLAPFLICNPRWELSENGCF